MMLIEVTQGDLREGVRKNCERCPVAIALARATGSVCSIDMEFMRAGSASTRIPNNVREFIIKFDSVRPVEPFTFEAPDSFLALAAAQPNE